MVRGIIVTNCKSDRFSSFYYSVFHSSKVLGLELCPHAGAALHLLHFTSLEKAVSPVCFNSPGVRFPGNLPRECVLQKVQTKQD
jgi:hypothetical protein